MAAVHEIKAKDGRIFRVLIENKRQELRLYDQFLNGDFDTVTCVLNGIHSISDFEKIVKKEVLQ